MTKFSALLLAGCAVAPPDEGPPSRAVPGQCREEHVQDLVGRQGNAELGDAALRVSGAETLRWIRPGEPITMDFQTGRVNIEIDSNGRSRRIYCG